jgi:hypothetical protein
MKTKNNFIAILDKKYNVQKCTEVDRILQVA